MNFADYLNENRISLRQAADELGYTHECIRLWFNKQRTPRPQACRDIIAWSNEAITLEELMDLPDSPRARVPTRTSKKRRCSPARESVGG